MWTVFAERFESTDFVSTTPRVYQGFTLERATKVKAVRTWFVIHNNPTFTSLEMRIYEGVGGVPTVLRNTFNKTWVLSELLTLNAYGLKEIYFDFTNPVWLEGGVQYFLVPWVNGNAFTQASHLAWVHGFPDPNTETAVTLSEVNVASVPYYMSLIGADR